MYTLYYTCTERGKKERAQWGKPQKTKEQNRKEWEEGEEALREAEKFLHLKKTILEQNENKNK